MLDVELRLGRCRLLESERICVTGTDAWLRNGGLHSGSDREVFLRKSCHFIAAHGVTHPETERLLRHLHDALYEKRVTKDK